jgi:hypothetical protein
MHFLHDLATGTRQNLWKNYEPRSVAEIVGTIAGAAGGAASMTT